MTDFQLLETTRDRVPLCTTMMPGKDSRAWNADLGFAVGPSGFIYLPDPADLASAGLAGEPVTGERYGRFGALDATLTVEGTEVADVPRGGKSRCYLKMTDEYLLGCFEEGLKIVGLDDHGQSVLRSAGFFVLWRWPLADIEMIEVDRVKKMFKWWDAQLSIRGRGGRSVFTASMINDYEKSRPNMALTDMQGFADALAGLVADRRGMAPGEAQWQVHASGPEDTRRVTF